MSVDEGAQGAIFTQVYISRYETCRYFRGLTGSQRTPGFWGVIEVVEEDQEYLHRRVIEVESEVVLGSKEEVLIQRQ